MRRPSPVPSTTMDVARTERLEQELVQLKQYCDKVTRELSVYTSAKGHVGPGATSSTRGAPGAPLPPWASNVELMTPLLLAYEARLCELEQATRKSFGLAEQSMALAQENDALRSELGLCGKLLL